MAIRRLLPFRRVEGATRTRHYGSSQSSGARASGSYRPSGGARGGGRRR